MWSNQKREGKMSDLQVFYEATPNPQSMKFIITAPIASESVHFTSVDQTARSPLARKLFGFPWAAGVFIGPSFVTVTKQEWVDWDVIADPLSDLIKEHLTSGEGVLLPSSEPTSSGINADDSSVVQKIKQILQDEIRPAVAMDGGDIQFDRFVDGKVYLKMHGACSGCPSSAYTLKEGIETRLKESIPEVTEVVAVE
jgi:Fe-S cluster biogenesis protein NfuA